MIFFSKCELFFFYVCENDEIANKWIIFNDPDVRFYCAIQGLDPCKIDKIRTTYHVPGPNIRQ